VIAFDATFLLDYLDGVDDTARYLEANEDSPFFAPTLVVFEVYRRVARVGGRDGIERVMSDLDWIEPLPLSEPAAREAALVEAELLDRGDRINLGDALIAGTCRHHGAQIVTRDSHFDRVDGLEVDRY
jgi:predicted nucleic acid-binding protein